MSKTRSYTISGLLGFIIYRVTPTVDNLGSGHPLVAFLTINKRLD